METGKLSIQKTSIPATFSSLL